MLVLDDVLVRCEQDVEFSTPELRDKGAPCRRRALEGEFQLVNKEGIPRREGWEGLLSTGNSKVRRSRGVPAAEEQPKTGFHGFSWIWSWDAEQLPRNNGNGSGRGKQKLKSKECGTYLVGDLDHGRSPFVELVGPVGQSPEGNTRKRWEVGNVGPERCLGRIFQVLLQHSRERDDDEEGAIDPFVLHEVRDEGDGLDGFSQSHLIRQDPVEVVVVQGHEPFQAFDLRGGGWGGGNGHMQMSWE